MKINIIIPDTTKIGSFKKGEKRIWIKPTAKRVGHYRRIAGTKEIEVNKSNIERIKAIIPNVNFDGATESQLNSIADGIEETVGKFLKVKIDGMGWVLSTDDYLFGPIDGGYIPKTKDVVSSRVILRKETIMNAAGWSYKTDKKFDIRRNINIEYYTDMIALHTRFKDEEQLAICQEKLENIKACSRLFVVQSEKDKVKGLVMHECYHAISVQMNLENIFSNQLVKYGVTDKDKMEVSDYAASNDRELWAETGSAIQSGINIPNSVKSAFNATMETIK